MRTTVQNILNKYGNDRGRLMDILLELQAEVGYITDEATGLIAEGLKISKVDVIQTLSFYHYFTGESKGEYAVYLNNSAVANMMGRAEVAAAFEREVGCKFGTVSDDGIIGLYETSCIGMSDQEPAAIINGKVFTELTPYVVKDLVAEMKSGKSADQMIKKYGDGKNSDELMKSMVFNNIRKKGNVIFPDYEKGSGLKKAVSMEPQDAINEVKNSYIRGRGGAGFPTGLKWDFCRKAEGEKYFVLCNCDEGEPGTFKERVLLTELPHLVFEGMAIAGYTIGSDEGILYLRKEYEYMGEYLNSVLEEMRSDGHLGDNVVGKSGFNFDIRIQFGAGAYVCGEESALIESCEGKRGEPRNRPPFPVQKGYKDQPSVVNNAETLASIVKIFSNGAEWYSMIGSRESTGTKLLSVSGDCKYPGVYEIEWGMRIRDLLELSGAYDVQAVQVGGPSGECIGPRDFKRTICYEDLPTGGSMIIVGNKRNLIKDVVLNFLDFFIEESCGSCSPCRNMTTLLKHKIEKMMKGHGVQSDLDDLKAWGEKMKMANRCGLGQTAANPVLSTLKNFREKYEEMVNKNVEYDTGFDLEAAIADSCAYVGRTPNL